MKQGMTYATLVCVSLFVSLVFVSLPAVGWTFGLALGFGLAAQKLSWLLKASTLILWGPAIALGGLVTMPIQVALFNAVISWVCIIMSFVLVTLLRKKIRGGI